MTIARKSRNSVAPVIGLLLASAPMSAFGKTYDCALDGPYAVGLADGEVTGAPIQIGGDAPGNSWTFALELTDEEGQIEWPDSPMQLNGEGPLIPTGENASAFFLVARGPCLFTELHCGSLVHVAEQDDGTALIQIHPIALSAMQDGSRQPFAVLLEGRCLPEGEDS
ncbi:MAG: hypothetical protein ABR601_03580 [Parasphingopyxis sp.]|nr:hypothetical protein [Sphingomonadales bacterium]